MIPIQALPYRYCHLPIGGGGYVTGFYFHPDAPQCFYCRTDIGGMYRFDHDRQRWVSLIDHVTPLDLRETYPISAALDGETLYIVSGTREEGSTGLLTLSQDGGRTFRRKELPVYVDGNLHGRGAGERLLSAAGTLFFASQTQGLWSSSDGGDAWHRVTSFPETGCTFVAKRGRLLLVGAEGLALRRGDQRGHSLYASLNGADFFPVPQPAYVPVAGSRLHGLVAQRCAFDEKYLYVSFSANGPRSQHVERGYSCDSGDCACGRLARYPLLPDGLGPMEDITPEEGRWGFSAVDARHGLLVTASIHRQDGDALYLSRDRGRTWTTVLHRLDKGRMDFRLPYMRPTCNGGRNLIHWLTDVKLDPHRPGTAWFNTGTGVFRTQNLTAETPLWQDWCDGMEETVHIGVHAPISGRVQLLDMVGDLGGFAFTDIDRHCDNSFADERGNRWITCLSCDWADAAPQTILVAARGNWTGETRGGLILTRDGARTWTRLPLPMGLSDELDGLLAAIDRPNVNAGWVAVGADGQRCVWAVAERIRLHARNVIVSEDLGQHFRPSTVLDRTGQAASGLMKPLADRCCPEIFYGFGEAGQLYVSTDGGRTFRQKEAPAGFPAVNFGLVDCADRTEIRVAAGEKGPCPIYLATGEGLWRLQYVPGHDAFIGQRLTVPGDRVFCVGLGLGRPGGDYRRDPKAIYLSGVIAGEYGFYRTLDEGGTFQRINTECQMYGSIHSIDGDKRVFGRFYLATGSSGLLYGEMEEFSDAL